MAPPRPTRRASLLSRYLSVPIRVVLPNARRACRRGGSTPPAAAITTRRVPQPRGAPTDVDRRLRASVAAPFAVSPSGRWFGFNTSWCAKHPRVDDTRNIRPVHPVLHTTSTRRAEPETRVWIRPVVVALANRRARYFFPSRSPAKANKHTHREREAFARRSHPDRSAVPPRNSNNNDRQGYRQGALDDRPNLASVASAVGRRSTG